MNKTEIIKILMETEQAYGLAETLNAVFGEDIRVKLSFSQDIYTTKIEDMILSARSYNALRRAGITTISQLIDVINRGNLKGIKNLGVKSYREIQTKIVVLGYDQLSEEKKKDFFLYIIDNNVESEIDSKLKEAFKIFE